MAVAFLVIMMLFVLIACWALLFHWCKHYFKEEYYPTASMIPWDK